MPPSAHWGKRPRNADGDEPFVRFSELSPAQKMERRREERAEKKERDRTLAYFKSVQRALEEHGSGGGDAGALASIVDGFFSELLKLLRADATFYILRNGTACRVIELALTNALLLHVKSLLYIFLGHICELMASPVASFTLETLLASLSQGLSALGESNPEALEAELIEGGVGTHTGSGVPSSATLLRSMSEELCERAEDLIIHDIGGRALRSVVLMLGGRAIRQAPQPQHAVSFSAILGPLAEAIVKALEDGYGREYNTSGPAESWLTAVQTPVTSLVVQSLLRVSEDGTQVDACVRRRIEDLAYKGKPLLHHFLVDPLGCHVFQSYVQVPPPVKVVEKGDVEASRDDGGHSAANTIVSSSSNNKNDNSAEADTTKNEGSDAESAMVPGGPDSCCWSRAADLVLLEVDNLLKPGSELVAQTGYVLQDLVLYAPTTLHLQWLWRRMLSPRLLLLFDVPALTAVLVQVVKRCAFEGVQLIAPTPTGIAAQLNADSADAAAGGAAAATTAGNEISHHGTVLPADVVLMLRKEAAQHVRYSPVSVAFQTAVCARICAVAKQRVTKGAVQYLLVDGALSDKGYEVARYLMHLHPSASRVLQYTLDKLQRDDLMTVVQHQKGSQFMQQYIKVAALANVKPAAPTPAQKSAKSTKGGATAATATTASTTSAEQSAGPLMRLFRRLQSTLRTLIYDKYAAFMVETLYECAPFGVKEALVTSLVPIYQEMRTANLSTTSAAAAAAAAGTAVLAETNSGEEPKVTMDGAEEDDSEEQQQQQQEGEGEEVSRAPSPAQQRYIAMKVMSKCCVEQYVHRKEDWVKLAERQCHVQQLLRRMLLNE